MATKRYKNVDMQRKTGDNKMLTAVVFRLCVFLFHFPLGSEMFLILTFRHRASCILGQAFRYSPENVFYIFNQQIYFII